MKMVPIHEATFETVKQMVLNGDFENKALYPSVRPKRDGYIFDESQTVAWNREKVEEFNKRFREDLADYQNGEWNACRLFKEHLVAAIAYESGLSNEKAQTVFIKAYDEGRDGGQFDVVSRAIDLCEFISEILG